MDNRPSSEPQEKRTAPLACTCMLNDARGGLAPATKLVGHEPLPTVAAQGFLKQQISLMR